MTGINVFDAASAANPSIADASPGTLSPSSALLIDSAPTQGSVSGGLDRDLFPEFPHIFAKDVGPAGTGLFTSKSLGPGDLVFQDTRPLGCVLDTPLLEHRCTWCLTGQSSMHMGAQKHINLKKCSGCRVVRFCNQDCQNSSWRSHHKHECKIFKALYPRILPNSVRMAVQFLILRKNGALPDSEWLKLISLQHHLTDLEKKDSREAGDLSLMAKAVQKYSGTKEDLTLVESLLGRIKINTLTLIDSFYDPIGLALSLGISLINHTCLPNSVISSSGPTLSVRTVHPISANTQITISYIDNTDSPTTRQHQLASRYFFTCKCYLCTAVPHPCTLSLLYPDPPPALLQAFGGSKSGPTALTTLDNSIEKSILESRSLELTPTAKANKLRDTMMQVAPLAQSGAYPPYRQPYARLRAELFQSLLSSSQFVEAFLQKLVIFFYIDPIHFPQPFHPVRLTHKYVLYKLTLHLAESLIYHRDREEKNKDGEVLALLAKIEGLDFKVITVGLLREIISGVERGGFGKDSRFASVIEAEMTKGFFQAAAAEKGGVTNRMVGEMWKDLRALVGAALDVMISS